MQGLRLPWLGKPSVRLETGGTVTTSELSRARSVQFFLTQNLLVDVMLSKGNYYYLIVTLVYL